MLYALDVIATTDGWDRGPVHADEVAAIIEDHYILADANGGNKIHIVPSFHIRNGAEHRVHSSARRLYTGFFQLYPGRPVAFGRHSRAPAHCGVGWRVALKVNGELVGAVGVSGVPTVQSDIDCAGAALALVSNTFYSGEVTTYP